MRPLARLLCFSRPHRSTRRALSAAAARCSGAPTGTDNGVPLPDLGVRARARIAAIDAVNPHPSASSSPLTDTFQRHHDYLRISLTERCNLRCTYCMPEEGVELSPDGKLLTRQEIIRIASVFVKAGVQKIRLTGGEPTVRKDLVDIVAELHALREHGLHTIAMTSNGIALKRKLPSLVSNGLSLLNISLDTLDPHKFMLMTRRNGMERVLESIEEAIACGLTPKVNCVVMRGVNDSEVGDFVEMTREKQVDIRFIEYMPFGGNKWKHEKLVPYAELLTGLVARFGALTRLVDHPNDTSKAYQVPNFVGRVGFITSMTDHFCGTCNRLRLTADGNLKVCLFGNVEISLRDALRSGASDDELSAVIGAAVQNKKRQHAVLPVNQTAESMYSTGYALRAAANTKRPLPFLLSPNYTGAFHRIHRGYTTSTTLTHVDGSTGKARMVDVSAKNATIRSATAQATVHLGPVAFPRVQENRIAKGDVLTVARIAAIQAAKRTSELIPLCHQIALTSVQVDLVLDELTESVRITTTASCLGQTGVEMEALTAASIAALTIYDMCKAVERGIRVDGVQLVSKSGGQSGDYLLGSNNVSGK